jgi:muconolactone delta-isomerase
MVVVLVVEDPRMTYDSLRLDGRSGHASVWRPASLPIRGSYGTYGLVEDWDDDVAVDLAERLTRMPMLDLMDPERDRNGDVTLGGKPGGPRISTATFHADLFDRMAERTQDAVGAPVDPIVSPSRKPGPSGPG